MMAVRDGLCGCGPFPVRVAVQAGFLRGNDPSGLLFFPSWVTLSAAVTLWGRWAGDLWVCLFTLEAEVSWWHFGGRGLYSLSSGFLRGNDPSGLFFSPAGFGPQQSSAGR